MPMKRRPHPDDEDTELTELNDDVPSNEEIDPGEYDIAFDDMGNGDEDPFFDEDSCEGYSPEFELDDDED